jgi:CheY-like chemotaxis protein
MGVIASVVLYIEDDDAVFALARFVLQEQAPTMRLYRARDGEEALTLLLCGDLNRDPVKPDLILLDLNLPRRNGLDVLSDLKASESLRVIPVVMFSTSADENDRNDALNRGAQDYVRKPSSLDLFVAAIKTACSLP